MKRGVVGFGWVGLLSAFMFAVASRAAAQGQAFQAATMAELVRWAIGDGSVPADAWPAIDEAYFAYRAAFEKMVEQGGVASDLAATTALDEASLAALGAAIERSFDRGLAEERRFVDRLRTALGGDPAAERAALRWRMARLLRLSESMGQGRLVPMALPTARGVGLAGQRALDVDIAAAAQLPAVIAAAERYSRTRLRAQAVRWVGIHRSEASESPTWLDATATLADAQATNHMALLQALRRMREAMVARVPEEERAATRLKLSSDDVDRLVRIDLRLQVLRHLRVDPAVRRAIDTTIAEYVAITQKVFDANVTELDRWIAVGDIAAFDRAWPRSGPELDTAGRRFEEAIQAALGPELADRWKTLASGTADMSALAEAVDPAHLDEIVSVDPYYQRMLLGRSSPRRETHAAVVAAHEPSTALVDAIHATAGPERRKAVDAALATHAAAWAQRVAPAQAALRKRAPGLEQQRGTTATIDAMPALLRAIRGAWDEIVAVDAALFAEITSVLADADMTPRKGELGSASERTTTLAMLRLRRAAELVRFDASPAFFWLGEVFPLPSDLPAAIDAASDRDLEPASVSIAQRALADLVEPLVQAAFTTGRRHDAMIALRGVDLPGPGRGASLEERREYGQKIKAMLGAFAAEHDCTLANVVEAWVGQRDALLAAWDGALPADDARALRAAALRGGHPHLLGSSVLADEAIADVMDLLERAPTSDAAATGTMEALRDVRDEHRRRQDDRLVAFAKLAAPWALPASSATDWTGIAPEVWLDRSLDLVRTESHIADDAARAVRDAWLAVGEERLRRVPAARIVLGLK